jgi:hypothetical protein
MNELIRPRLENKIFYIAFLGVNHSDENTAINKQMYSSGTFKYCEKFVMYSYKVQSNTSISSVSSLTQTQDSSVIRKNNETTSEDESVFHITCIVECRLILTCSDPLKPLF